MPLFNCSKCNCVENTACGYYWWPKSKGQPVLCSECHSGTWHGKFPKKPATSYLVANDGFLWRTDELLPKHMRIVGVIQEDGSTLLRNSRGEAMGGRDDEA